MLANVRKVHPLPEAALTAAILAGGRARRLEGRKKAFLRVGGESILTRTLSVVVPASESVIVIANEPLAFSDLELAVFSDVYPGCGALGGLYTALFHSPTSWVLALACDMPFLSGAMLALLRSRMSPDTDAVVPRTRMGFEPLCALYNTRCLPAIKSCLGAGRLKVSSFYPRVRLREIPEERLRAADPELRSFANVNTPQDLAAAREHPGGEPPPP